MILRVQDTAPLYPQNTAGVLRCKCPQDAAVSSGCRIPRMPSVSQDANSRLQTKGGSQPPSRLIRQFILPDTRIVRSECESRVRRARLHQPSPPCGEQVAPFRVPTRPEGGDGEERNGADERNIVEFIIEPVKLARRGGAREE